MFASGIICPKGDRWQIWVKRPTGAKPHILCYMLLRFFLCFDMLISLICKQIIMVMATEKHTGLDFDGTVTDVEREALPYGAGYKADMAQHLGIGAEELEEIWNQVVGEIQSSPGEFGWRDGGTNKIVAPATADPLLLTRVTAEQLLSRLKDDPESLRISPARVLAEKLPQDAATRHELLESFFGRNYGKLETHFRDGAADFLMSLLELGRLTVFTNSKTKGVLAKLATLREANPALPEIDVRGGAEKFTLVPDWVVDGVATELDCSPHLVRPVFTQRGKYHAVLKESGILEASSRVIAGDVWELDLMLPILLDMKGAFITRSMTPAHEIAIVKEEISRGRARIAGSLEGLLSGIRELHQD